MRNRVANRKRAPEASGLVPDGGGRAKRVQIGGRVPDNMNVALKLSAAVSPYSKDDILEDALKLFFGIEDEEVRKRQKEVLAKLSELKEGKLLPFELPLTPIKNNATLTSRGSSNKLTFRFTKRMGS